jgi:TetR/AcrR family tetracycline transcriptional repressor
MPIATKLPTPPRLDTDRIVAAAFTMLDDEGLDGLSMRALAGRLGVQAPALYWHFTSKGELLSAMARRVYSVARAEKADDGDWRSWLIGFGTALHVVFTEQRDRAQLCAIARPAGDRAPDAVGDAIAAPLTARGLDRERALSRQASVIAFTLGWALYETNGPMLSHLASLLDVSAAYRDGLEAMVRGFPDSV